MGQTMWLKKFVHGLRVVNNIERPLKLYCDNESAVLYTHNNKKSRLTSTLILGFML
jgi:hypothetical protein